MTHEDSDPVIFGYSASCNAAFQGEEPAEYTWGEWREMTEEQRASAREEFIYNTLGVEVYEV